MLPEINESLFNKNQFVEVKNLFVFVFYTSIWGIYCGSARICYNIPNFNLLYFNNRFNFCRSGWQKASHNFVTFSNFLKNIKIELQRDLKLWNMNYLIGARYYEFLFVCLFFTWLFDILIWLFTKSVNVCL